VTGTSSPEAQVTDSTAGPIFIGGADRSGKTMLRAFLTSHRRISIPAIGSNMWTYFYGQHGDLADEANFERCLAAMLRYKHVRFLEPDAARIREEFKAGAPTYGRLFAIFQRQHAEREGKPRWGDQSGLVERYADEVFAAYPDAVMLHLMRDPRDRWEAVRARWGDGHGGVGGATARWRYSARLAARNVARHAARYAVVRFEDLVLQPEASLRAVCRTISETYEPEMLTMSGATDYRARLAGDAEPAGALTDPAPLDPAYVGRYRGRVSRADVVFIESIAGIEMAQHGYRPVAAPLAGAQRIRYRLGTWPANRLRLAAWMARERLQQRAPGQVGRRPSTGKMA